MAVLERAFQMGVKIPQPPEIPDETRRRVPTSFWNEWRDTLLALCGLCMLVMTFLIFRKRELYCVVFLFPIYPTTSCMDIHDPSSCFNLFSHT